MNTDEFAVAIAGLTNKQLKVYSDLIKKQRDANIKANKEAAATKKAEAAAKKLEKNAELKKACENAEMLVEKGAEFKPEMVAQLKKIKRPALNWLADEYGVVRKDLKVGELRDALAKLVSVPEPKAIAA